MSDLPQMYWCEECAMDVDVTAGGCCIHCGDQVMEPNSKPAQPAGTAPDRYEIPAFLRRSKP